MISVPIYVFRRVNIKDFIHMMGIRICKLNITMINSNFSTNLHDDSIAAAIGIFVY